MGLTFELDGNIIPKARARITSHGNYHNPRYSAWMDDAISELNHQKALKEYYQELSLPCSLEIVLINPSKRGDADNIAGSIMDALVKAGIIPNDNLNNINNLHIKVAETVDKLTRTTIIIKDKDSL